MYHALYRKYRPRFFNDVVGQNVIVQTLKNSIINNRIGHAYMFFGPRGTGKTTVSKIFARSVNCLEPIDGESCGKCSNCLHSYEKECVDIIEMDAASNNGVDEIRELRSKISLVPAELKYKVYIVDEVHMLSTGAFNALLKTLEEPPEHAIFILATTDPQKVPETIISRCQCFSFKRISENDIVEKLRFISEQENINIDDSVLIEIAKSSDGGMRDSIGLLDKLSSYTSEKITYDKYIELNELLTSSDIEKFCMNVFKGDISSIIKQINEINNSGKNIIQVLSQIMYFLRDKIVDYYIKNDNSFNSDQIKLSELLVNIINEKMFDIKRTGNPRIYIEILLLKFIEDNILVKKYSISNLNNDENISREIFSSEISAKKEKNSVLVEEKNKKSKNVKINKTIETTVIEPGQVLNINEIMDVRTNNTLATADKTILKNEIANLDLLNDYTFDQNIGYLVCEILNSKFRAASDKSIVISYEYDSIVKQNLLNLDKLIDTYNKITNSNKNFAIISDAQWDKYKTKYIESLKSGNHFVVKKEPEKVFKKIENDDIISNSTVDLFGDIVEID